MKSVFSLAKTWIIVCVLFASGCARYNNTYNNAPPPPYDPYAQIDFDDLLNFSANMAGISASARSDICRTLLKSDKGPSDISVQLHLLEGRLFSEDCGDIASILDAVAAMPPGSLRDERAQKLITIHSEALKRLNSQPRKIGSTVERKSKTTPASATPETKEIPGAKKDEARLLREKLEAIRSMEKQLDETGNEK